MTNEIKVGVGQIWADNDRRSAGRRVRVVALEQAHAVVELVDLRGRPARGHESQQKAEPGRRTRIRLSRFRPTSTGYRLIQDSGAAAAPAIPGITPTSTKEKQ